jgi:predicted MFS family arabinose efflux permease
MKNPEEKPLIEETYEPPGSFERYKKSFSDLLKAPRDLWLLFTIKFCLYGSFSTFISALSIYITEVKNYSDLYLCIAFASIGIPGLIFFIVFGSFNDRYGIRYTLILGSLTACLPFLVISMYDDLLISALIVMFPGAFSI